MWRIEDGNFSFRICHYCPCGNRSDVDGSSATEEASTQARLAMTTLLILSIGVALAATLTLVLVRSKLKKQGRQATK